MIKCKACGVDNRDDADFCKVCGVKIDKENLIETKKNDEIENSNTQNPSQKQIKPEKTFTDKKAILSIILSSLGLFCFIALPAQILGLIFGIGGVKSKRFKPLAVIGIIFSSISLVIFVFIVIFIIINFNNILETNFFNAFYDSYKSMLG